MSNQWRHLHLGDVVNLKRGYDLPERLRKPGHVPIVTSSGESGTHNEAKVKGPGVVTGRYGTLGEVFYVEQDYWPHNTTLYVQDFKGNHPRFISYFLQTLGFASQNAAGAVPGVNRNHLHRLEVAVPDICTQRKIASILSAYDDLIENNTRRIAILEDMAQSIYREWFVNFRFPGHENVKLVDSPLGQIPEGWEAKKLGDYIELPYGKALKAGDRKGGEVAVYGSGGIVGYHDEFLSEGPGIVVGRKGNVGSVFWSDIPFYPIDTAFYVKTELPLHYVYFNLLLSQQFLNSDAAVPGLNRNQAYSNPLIVPESGLLESFTQQIEPIFALTRSLRSRNENLRTTRDLLLPKLISGKLDVEDLDIDSGLTAEALEEATALF